MSAPTDAADVDVAIVGGGPAGCSAGVFTARYGLDTLIFDRGRSSLRRCAYLENYLGFPAGIDIDTFYRLMHDHAKQAGCELVSGLVESIEHTDEGFIVETQEARRVTTERVIAATRYGGEYLRSLDDDAMFETYEHDGEEHEQFNRSYADADGETPIAGLYVASPSTQADQQAIIAAGRGARTGRALIADVRRERGYPDALADQYDWLRRTAELTGEWRDRERWREWFDDRVPAGHELDAERRESLRETEIDRRFEEYLSTDEIDQRVERGYDRILEHINDDRLLEHIDDDRILECAREIETERQSSSPGD